MLDNIRRNWVIFLFLALITVAVFWRAPQGQFLHWDDPAYASENRHVQNGLSMEGIRWSLTAYVCGNWHPLTMLSLMADHDISVLTNPAGSKASNPTVFHLTNLTIHVLNALLLFALLNAVTGYRWRSAIIAALFAVHPLHVESVAWVSERKDVLSTLFAMLVFLAYVGYVRKPGIKRYLLVALLLTLGLVSKPMLVSLPLVLLMLDFWPLKRVAGWTGDKKAAGLSWKQLLIEKIPLLAICAVSCVLTLIAQKHGHAVQTLKQFPLGVRLANALVSYVAYLWKMVWPAKLAAYYEHPGTTLPVWQVICSGLLLALITALALRSRRKYPWFTMGWLWYLVTLVPVIGIVQVGAQALACRYTYTTLIGIFIILVWAACELLAKAKVRIPILSALAVLILVPLSVRAYTEVLYWHDSLTLFRRNVEVAPCEYAHGKLAEAHYNVGMRLLHAGRPEDAIHHLLKYEQFNPKDFHCRNNLGAAYLETVQSHPGDPTNARLLEEALSEFLAAVRMRPKALRCRNNVGVIYAMQGKHEAAREQFLSVLKLDPTNADARDNLRILESSPH